MDLSTILKGTRVTAISLDPMQKLIAFATWSSQLFCFKLTDFSLMYVPAQIASYPIENIEFSRNGSIAMISFTTGLLNLYDASNGKFSFICNAMSHYEGHLKKSKALFVH